MTRTSTATVTRIAAATIRYKSRGRNSNECRNNNTRITQCTRVTYFTMHKSNIAWFERISNSSDGPTNEEPHEETSDEMTFMIRRIDVCGALQLKQVCVHVFL